MSARIGYVRLMSVLGQIIKYVQQSERLIVVTVVLSTSGVVAYLTERAGLFVFAGLPDWVRPVCTLAWIVVSVHVLVRAAITAVSGGRTIAQFATSLPRMYRQRVADRPIVSNLLSTGGLAREVLCYARYRQKNHIWPNGEYRWLNRLKEGGLVELSDALFGTAHYRIHDVAWDYMNQYPNQFVHVLGWRNPPWAANNNESETDRSIEAARERTNLARASGWHWDTSTWRGLIQRLRLGKA